MFAYVLRKKTINLAQLLPYYHLENNYVISAYLFPDCSLLDSNSTNNCIPYGKSNIDINSRSIRNSRTKFSLVQRRWRNFHSVQSENTNYLQWQPAYNRGSAHFKHGDAKFQNKLQLREKQHFLPQRLISSTFFFVLFFNGAAPKSPAEWRKIQKMLILDLEVKSCNHSYSPYAQIIFCTIFPFLAYV